MAYAPLVPHGEPVPPPDAPVPPPDAPVPPPDAPVAPVAPVDQAWDRVVSRVGLLFTFLTFLVTLSSWLRGDCATFTGGLTTRIEQKYVFKFDEGPIIQRKKLNETLSDTFRRAKLTVILGQRQAGKSVLVKSWLNGRSNVYQYSPEDGKNLGKDEEKACGREFFDKDTLIKALRKVGKTVAHPAIVVFEINHDVGNKAITGIYESIKNIVYDSELPHTKGLLVLSNSYAMEAFPRDNLRYETIWVGDLTEDEAKQFIEAKTNDAQQYIQGLNATGFHVGQLEAALRKESLDAWKAVVLKQVRSAAGIAETREIMQRLPLSAEGVEWQHLRLGNDSAKLIRQVRGDVHRVVLYSVGPQRFHWASPGHYEAWTMMKHEYQAEKEEL